MRANGKVGTRNLAVAFGHSIGCGMEMSGEPMQLLRRSMTSYIRHPNPALGAAVDILPRHGGTAILSELPEIYGVEHTLTRRAATVDIGRKLIERIRW